MKKCKCNLMKKLRNIKYDPLPEGYKPVPKGTILKPKLKKPKIKVKLI